MKLVYCAYFAAMRNVTFSPPPAIHSGMPFVLQRFRRHDRAVDLVVLAVEADPAVTPGVRMICTPSSRRAKPYPG